MQRAFLQLAPLRLSSASRRPFLGRLLLRRLRMPLPLAPAACRCRRGFDVLGVNGDLGSIPKGKAVDNDLYSALVWSPRLVVQVPKEDVLLDSGSCFAANTGCCSFEGPATGTQYPRARACRDMVTTLVAPLTSTGAPRRLRGRTADAALQIARRAKERAYPEFVASRRCHLTVLGIEIGGRWSSEAATFVRLLARCGAGPFLRSVHFRPRTSLVGHVVHHSRACVPRVTSAPGSSSCCLGGGMRDKSCHAGISKPAADKERPARRRESRASGSESLPAKDANRRSAKAGSRHAES